MTTPEVRLPYSTDGMPRITSIDSTLSGDTERRSTPFPAVVWSLMPFCDWFEALPASDGERACRLPSFESGAPSTITAAPKALLALEPISRMAAWPTPFRLGLTDRLPGSNWNMSPMLMGWMWRMASSPIFDVEPAPVGCAVTTTSSSPRLSGVRAIRRSLMSAERTSFRSTGLYPRNETL